MCSYFQLFRSSTENVTDFTTQLRLFPSNALLIDESLKCICFDGRGDSVVTKLYN